MIIFVSTVPSTSSPGVLTAFIAGILSGVVVTFFGALIAYYYQRKSKLCDLRDNARSTLQYVHMVLCLQRAKLTNIPKALEARASSDFKKISLRKITFPSLSATITQEDLQKILLHHKFSNSKAYPVTFQIIITADGAFQKCVSLIYELNESLNEDRFLNANNESQVVYLQIIDSLLQGIKFSHEEAVILNEKARKKIESIGREVFGKEFVLPKLDDKIVMATEL